MQPYREPDRRELNDFVQHVSIAETLLAEFNSYPRRAQQMFRDGQVSEPILKDLQLQAASAWEQLWIQLGQARDIAARLGRDVTKFDLSRKRAGDIWGGGAELTFGAWRSDGRRQTRPVVWSSAYNEPARAAVKILRAAIPEVVIPAPRRDEPVVDLAPRRIWPWVGLLLVVALIVSRSV